ncbi:MAG TPA: hypothetical protein VH351_14485 [Bryobacteraceae bacterium]|jgi:hypothetical protein|nr:hypothetical protein [Bryobacteraceae bacterium]
MADRIIFWLNVVSTAADALLLLRFLQLRLTRVYTFIGLYLVITVLLDSGFWLAGFHTPASDRVFVYSRFVMALVFPLAAWDVFEEVQEQTAKFRRVHTLRLLSGFLMAAIFALLFSAFFSSDEEVSGISGTAFQSALALWAISTVTSLLFIVNMRRSARAQQLALPLNTRIFWVFFLTLLLCEIAQAIEVLMGPWISRFADPLEMLFGTIGIAVVLWCTIRLKRIATNETAPQSQGVS